MAYVHPKQHVAYIRCANTGVLLYRLSANTRTLLNVAINIKRESLSNRDIDYTLIDNDETEPAYIVRGLSQ